MPSQARKPHTSQHRGLHLVYFLPRYCFTNFELFSFPNPPLRPSQPEAQGLRHLAITVSDLDNAIAYLVKNDVSVEPVRIDEITNNRFTFFADPDGLPLELVEVLL